MAFPDSFLFGAATAAYQIEGAVREDGRGPSIWDAFVHRGKIRYGHTGDVACDHYHRFREDVALMRELGLGAYRFSISWPRVVPEGSGAVNQAGLDFYRRLADALGEAGITPFATLYHWDLPLALDRRYGGFLDRRIARDFADYAEIVVRALGDRIRHWITFNEPWEHACFGHLLGEHAPGRRRPGSYLTVIHHQLLAHALALERLRAHCPRATVGIVLSLTPIHPRTDSERDRRAARVANEFMNFVTLDPLLRGHYPEDLWRRLRCLRPRLEPGDLERISAPVDFVGVNNYQREFARASRLVPFLGAWVVGGGAVPEAEFQRGGAQYTSMGWEVYPDAIHEVLDWLRCDYGNPPVYVTENGAAFDDRPQDGAVRDDKRIAFLQGYLGKVEKAIGEGADVRGYFVWSLLDNFEWALGYSKRFGLIYVDFETQRRIIKQSGIWYRDLIAAGGRLG